MLISIISILFSLLSFAELTLYLLGRAYYDMGETPMALSMHSIVLPENLEVIDCYMISLLRQFGKY